MLEDDPMLHGLGAEDSDTEETAHKKGPIDVSDGLSAFLREEYDRCFDQTLENDRATAIKRYNGEPYGDEVEGWSQVVSRDTAKTIDYMTNSILRCVVSGDHVVEFVHKNTDLAQQATETIMHLFMDQQDGYRVLHDWLKSGLLEKNAVAMTFMETPSPKRHTFEGVSEMALTLAMQQGANIVEAEPKGIGPDGDMQFDAAEHVEQPPEFRDYAVPNEEFYCSVDARTIDEALMKGRRMLRLVADLEAEGYSGDDLDVAQNDAMPIDALSLARNDNRSQWSTDRGERQRQIWWHEEFVRYDENGDGIAELLYIRRTDDFTIFDIQEMEDVNDHPFEDWCPFPMPHRRVGQSLADKVMPYERINTVLTRQTLDSIYLANMPLTYLHEDAIGVNTIEDILDPRPGGVVRWRGNNPPVERQASFSPADGFQMMEHIKGELEELTGITRLNQGLDAETLNKTAAGQAMLQAQGQQMEEYLARNFGNALARLFTKKAKLLKRYGRPIVVPIDGEYQEVDPTKWPDDMICRPLIGLGTSRKEQRIGLIHQVMGMQQQLILGGFGNIVNAENLFNAAKAFVNETKLGDVTQWFTDPMQVNPMTGQKFLPPQPPKPDPHMMKAQAQIQAQQQKQVADQQAQANKAQLDAAALQQKGNLEAQKLAANIGLQQEKAHAEAVMNEQRMAMEANLAERQAEMDMALARQKAEMDHHVKMEGIKKNRSGGSLDA